MTNTEAQKVIADYLLFHTVTDTELEALVMAGEALEEWISVDEMLPPITNEEERTTDRVLIMGTHGFYMDTAWYDYRHKGWEDVGQYFQNVTHWRHLPEPPEVK